MLTPKPIKTPDDIIVERLIERYSHLLMGRENVDLVAMLSVDESAFNYANGDLSFGVDAIVAEYPDNDYTNEPKHAHYRIELQMSISLVPCPDSH